MFNSISSNLMCFRMKMGQFEFGSSINKKERLDFRSCQSKNLWKIALAVGPLLLIRLTMLSVPCSIKQHQEVRGAWFNALFNAIFNIALINVKSCCSTKATQNSALKLTLINALIYLYCAKHCTFSHKITCNLIFNIYLLFI